MNDGPLAKLQELPGIASESTGEDGVAEERESADYGDNGLQSDLSPEPVELLAAGASAIVLHYALVDAYA